MSRTARRALQLVGAARVAGGAALLVRPELVAARCAGPDGGVVPAPVCRVLGLRLLGQGVVGLWRPARSTVAISGAVDLSHALSMAPAAAIWPRYRRAAGRSATVAVASVAAEALLARGLPDRGRR